MTSRGSDCSKNGNSPDRDDDEEESEEEYSVEAIRKWRYNLREKQYEYLVKWKNYPEEDNTWEPKENLTNCAWKLEKFEKNLSKKESRLYRAKYPESMTGFQRHADFIKCIGADMGHDSDIEEDSPKQDKQKFYCLVQFSDSDYAEEVTIKEFYTNEPKKAFAFFERRLLQDKQD